MRRNMIFVGLVVLFFAGMARADEQAKANQCLDLLKEKKYSDAKGLIEQWKHDQPEEQENIAFCEELLKKVEAEPDAINKEKIMTIESLKFVNKQLQTFADSTEKLASSLDELEKVKQNAIQSMAQSLKDMKNTKPKPPREPYSSDDPSENLLDAVHKGDPAKVDEYIAEGADVNKVGLMGFSAVMWACQKGNLDIVKKLVSKGARLDVKGDMGQTPLTVAVTNRNVPLAEYLINNGADVHQKTTPMDDTLLIEAARLKDLKLMQFFVEKGIDVNAWNSLQQTALMIAVEKNDLAAVEYLLDHGAKPTMRNLSDKTALDLAKEKGYQEVEELLK